MALNLKALKNADKELNSRGGSNLYLGGKDIGEETFVRVLPPKAELNGLYFLEQTGYWINKQYYVSPATFGLPCPIEERLDAMKKEAEKTKDKELDQLIDGVGKKPTFLIPILLLDPKFNNDDEIIDMSVKDGKAKVLQSGSMLMKAINKVVLSPKIARKLKKVENGITDREEGYNIVLSKTGKGLDTEYTAYEDEQMEMDAKYYENVPSILNLTKAKIYTDEYLNAMLDHYFDGDPKPDDSLKVSRYKDELDSDKEDSKDEEEAPKRRRRSAAKEEPAKEEKEETQEEEAPKRRRRRSSEEEETPKKEEVKETEESEEEQPKRRRRRSSTEEKSEEKTEGSQSSLLDELEDLDD